MHYLKWTPEPFPFSAECNDSALTICLLLIIVLFIKCLDKLVRLLIVSLYHQYLLEWSFLVLVLCVNRRIWKEMSHFKKSNSLPFVERTTYNNRYFSYCPTSTTKVISFTLNNGYLLIFGYFLKYVEFEWGWNILSLFNGKAKI